MAAIWRGVTGIFSLHTNATYGRLALVKSNLLLLPHADVNAVYTELGTTALHAAAYNGHLPVVQYLHAVWHANPLVLSADGWTPLHCAAMNGYLPVVKYLIEQANVRTTIESNEGWTCLHCAAAQGFLPVVKYLVEKHKMDVEFTTYNGWSPLHWACCNGYLNVVKYLLGVLPTSVLAKTHCGSTVLHLAARQGQTAVLEYLLDESPNGAGTTTGVAITPAFIAWKNDAGFDAFTLACLKGKLAAVLVLEKRLGRTNFSHAELQQAHDLHLAAAKQEKTHLNRALVKYLREWMQERAFQDKLAEESVEVLSMREMLAAPSSVVQPVDLATGEVTLAAAAPETGEEAKGAEEEDATAEESESDLSLDEESENEEDAPPALSSPPGLDNAHLARSPLASPDPE